jgi:hypothetical protein
VAGWLVRSEGCIALGWQGIVVIGRRLDKDKRVGRQDYQLAKQSQEMSEERELNDACCHCFCALGVADSCSQSSVTVDVRESRLVLEFCGDSGTVEAILSCIVLRCGDPERERE